MTCVSVRSILLSATSHSRFGIFSCEDSRYPSSIAKYRSGHAGRHYCPHCRNLPAAGGTGNGLALSVVSKRLATLERWTKGRLMARAVWYRRCCEYRVRRKQKSYEKSRHGKFVAGSWHRQHRALPNLSIHDPNCLVRHRRVGRSGSDAYSG